MSRLFVVRHGETDFNVQGRYTGRTDIELNETGVAQARQIAESLREYSIDIILSSPLKRAYRTAAIIQEQINKPIIILEDFIERSAGVFEGLTRDEVIRRYPELWKQNILGQLDAAPPGGEPIRQTRERVHRGLLLISDKYRGSNVLLATHGYVSREIYGYFNPVSEEELRKFSMKNCQVAEYGFE